MSVKVPAKLEMQGSVCVDGGWHVHHSSSKHQTELFSTYYGHCVLCGVLKRVVGSALNLIVNSCFKQY